jgi:hypothetical protein
MNNLNGLTILLFLFALYYVHNKLSCLSEAFGETRTYSTDGDLGETFNKILRNYNFTKVENTGQWYFPSDYNPCEKQAKELNNSLSKYIYVMNGCDIVGSKIDLWKALRDYYGLIIAESYMPRTYLYSNKDDMFELERSLRLADKKKMLILKNYNQRQEGLKIVSSWDEINDETNKKEFYLIQEYLYNPLIISKRKTNIRVYYLIVCRHGNVEGYIYYNGFMYYTPKFYDPDDYEFDKHITTGYIDRHVYEENPLTIEDLRKYLGENKAAILDRNIKKIMRDVTIALSHKVCSITNGQKVNFQVYGVDVAPVADLSVKLMEINKGPDLGAKDERDGFVKSNMQADIFKIIDPNISSDNSNGFIRVY